MAPPLVAEEGPWPFAVNPKPLVLGISVAPSAVTLYKVPSLPVIMVGFSCASSIRFTNKFI